VSSSKICHGPQSLVDARGDSGILILESKGCDDGHCRADAFYTAQGHHRT
jgi:hypothetical protein